MNKVLKLLSPFMNYINVGIAKSFAITIALNIGLMILFNPKPEDIYISALSLYSFVGIILSLVLTKQLMSTNLSWMLNLPYSKLKIIGINILLTFYAFIIFFVSIILLGFVSYFISFKTFQIDLTNTIHFNLSDITNGISNAFRKIDVQFLAGFNAFVLFIMSILISIKNIQNVRLFNQFNQPNLKLNIGTQRKIQFFALFILCLTAIALQIDKIFSPMNIIFAFSLIPVFTWKGTCNTIIDESKRAKIILYSIIGYVFISNSVFAIMTYGYALNGQNPILKRIEAYHYLGLFAPRIEKELQDELNKSSSNKIDIDLLMAIDGQDPSRLLKGVLKAPYRRNNFNHFIQDQKTIYQLDANQVDLDDFMSDQEGNQFVEKLRYIDFGQFENEKAIKFLNGFFTRYKYLDYNVCWYISHKKLAEIEIRNFLNSDKSMSRYCGLVLSRYYPTYDFTQSLIQMAKNKDPLEFQSLFITASIYQGAHIKADELYKLKADTFTNKKVDCPGESTDFVKRFKELSYSQQVKCPRFYLARTPINNAGMDNMNYISDPIAYFDQKEFEKSVQQREKNN